MDISSGTTQLQFLADAQGRRLSKTFTPEGTRAYPQTTFFNQRIVEVDLTIESVMAALQDASAAGACFVRGIVNDRQAQGIRRLKGKVIARHDTRVQCFDTDSLSLPGFAGDFLDIRQVGAAVVAELGLAYDVIAQFSASHGMKGDKAGIHLFVITNRAFTDAALKSYAKTQNTLYRERYPSASASAKLVDPALFCDNQVHYIADPVFNDVPDPLEGRPRWAVIKGENAFWSGPPELPPVQRRERLKGVRCGAGAFREQVGKLAAGEMPNGVHAAVLEAAKAGSKTGLSAEEVIAALAPAAHDGAIKAGREDALDRLAGGEVEKSVEWAFQNLSAEDEAANAGFELKSTFDLTLRALAHQETERLAAAITTFNRFKRRAPKRQHPALVLRQIGDATRLDAAERRGLEQTVLSFYASRKAGVSRWLDLNNIAEEAREFMSKLRQFRKGQNDSLAAMRPSGGDGRGDDFGEVPPEVVSAASFDAAKAVCFQDARPLYIVRAPHGSGKTTAVLVPAEAQVRTAGGGTVVLTHRRTLDASLCKAFNATSYLSEALQAEKAASYQVKRDAKGQRLEQPLKRLPCVTIVHDSLTNPNFAARAARADLLLVDEISQLVASQGATGSQMNPKTQVAVQRTFFAALKKVKHVILADADITPATLAYLARAGRPIKIIDVAAPEAPMTARLVHGAREFADILAWIARQLQAGKRPCVAVDSASAVESIEHWCQANMPAGGFRCLTSDNQHEHQDFLADINQGVKDLSLLAYSPVMGSGVSLVTPHFDAHLFAYHAVVGPTDAIQMMKRDRTCGHVDVMLIGEGFSTDETEFENLWHDTCAKNAEARKDATAAVWELDEYAIQRASLEAEINTRRQDAANNLIWLMMARGWDVEFVDSEIADEEREAGREVAKESKESRIEAILAAPKLTAAELDGLRERKEDGKATRDEILTLEHYALRRNLALTEDMSLDRHRYDLAADDKTMMGIRRLEWLLADERRIAIENLRDIDRPGPNTLLLGGRQRVQECIIGEEIVTILREECRESSTSPIYITDARGILPATHNGFTLDTALAQALYDRLLANIEAARAYGLPVPKREPQSFLRWGKNFLEGMGFRFCDAHRLGADGSQNPDLQLTALKQAGCTRLFTDKATGAHVKRPELTKCLKALLVRRVCWLCRYPAEPYFDFSVLTGRGWPERVWMLLP